MQQALADQLQCPVCLELYRDPVLLACGHSLCQQCATQQIDKLTIDKQPPAGPTPAVFACPLCRELTPVPDGAGSLKKNHVLRNVVDQLPQLRQPPETTAEGPTCGICEERPAVYGCQKCEAVLCQPCHTKHHVGVLLRHAITDVDTYQRAAQRAKLVCAEHDERLKLFCPKCVQLVCTVCGFGKHKDHSCKPMEEA
eukprot:EG_transcript_32924